MNKRQGPSESGQLGSKRVRFGGGAVVKKNQYDGGSNGSSSSSPKTGRPPSDMEEVDDSDLLETRKSRRKGVNVDGYRKEDASSESDDEEEEGAEEEQEDDDMDLKGKRKKIEDDDEEDDEDEMFADPEELARKEALKSIKDKRSGRTGPKKFNVRQIKGEDLDVTEQEYDSDGNPMIEAFNMKQELEEGGEIDESGNFIRKEDPDRFHDNWLDGVSHKDIQAAKDAADRKKRQAAQKDAEEAMANMSKDDIYLELVNILRPSESVIEALQRLGGGSGSKGGSRNLKSKQKSWQKNKKMDVDHNNNNATDVISKDEQQRKQAIEQLTDLCDKMMAMGHFNIYEDTYEQIVRALRRSGIIEDDWVVGTPVKKPVDILDDDDDMFASSSGAYSIPDPPHVMATQWEYMWANQTEGQEEEIFGPYASEDMKAWASQGFFEQGILVRKLGDKKFEQMARVEF